MADAQTQQKNNRRTEEEQQQQLMMEQSQASIALMNSQASSGMMHSQASSSMMEPQSTIMVMQQSLESCTNYSRVVAWVDIVSLVFFLKLLNVKGLQIIFIFLCIVGSRNYKLGVLSYCYL